MVQTRCETPFERGPQLCSHCRTGTGEPGLRRCSRLVAASPAMRALLDRAVPIAEADAPVVLFGETGAGKEVLARAIHANSSRRAKPFVAVNVAALPAELLESELFGHVKGAFTGALSSKRGLFEEADGGSLLLDEIGEMPLALQAKLLRVLQDGEVRRVGEVRPFSVDVRILCATHRDLRQAVRLHRFREDLYYRLKVFALTVPPLRERREDLEPLARMFLQGEGHASGELTAAARRTLETYRWPGNVRELVNAMRHGAALSRGGPVDVGHLPDDVVHPLARPVGDEPLRPLAEVEREHVVRVLEACGGRQGDAARVLGIGRTTLWRKLRGLGLEAAD